jgi:glutamate synthase (NADPH/NADH) small chain
MAVGSKVEENLVNSLNLEHTKYGNIKINEKYMTSEEKIFAGGDLAGIKSTVAWAAKSGRDAAYEIDRYLKNK